MNEQPLDVPGTEHDRVLDDAIEELEKSSRGIQALAHLAVLLHEGGISLDLRGQYAVYQILDCAWKHGLSGSVLDALATSLPEGGADAR